MHRIPLSLVTLAVAAALILALAPAPAAAQDVGSSPVRLAAASCELNNCGEHGPTSDPDGLTAAGPAGVTRSARSAGSASPARLAASSCALNNCGEHGPTSDPNGLAARPEAQGPVAPVPATLRLLLPV